MGLALGGSHGLFTNPAKSIGRIFSLKNVVPDITTALGAAVGGPFAPVTAGIGNYVGREIEGETGSQALLGGVESGALDYATAGLGNTVGSDLQGTYLGNALSGAGKDISGWGGDLGITGQGGLVDTAGNYLSGLGQSVGLTGQGGLASEISGGLGTAEGDVSSGLGAAGNELGITGPGGLTSDVSNWWNNVAGTPATAGAAAGGGTGGLTQAITPGGVTSSPSLASALTSGAGPAAATTPGASILGGGGGAGGALGGAITPAPAPAPAPAGGGGGLFGGHPALGVLAAAPAVLQAIRGSQPFKGETQLQQSAAQLGQQGQQLQSYLQSGTLPPGAQAAINQATASAQAAIRSQYASMGMEGSSSETQDLAAAQQQGVAQANAMAMQLLSSGMQSTNMSDQMYQDIMNQSMTQDQNLSAAIGNFAAMAAGEPGGTGGKNGSVTVSL